MKKNQNFGWFQKKLFLRMKLTILTLIFCAMQVSASTILRGQNLNLQIENGSIRDVLKSIEKESSYRFFFNDSFTDLDKLVHLDIKNGTLADVMDELLSSSDMSYKLMTDSLVVIAPKNELQQKKVTGTVTDAKTGEPMPGVNVLVEGTITGETTDADGKYSITAVNEKSVLVFSFVGYEPYRQTVGTRAIIDVQLSPTTTSLDEVVVIGYGTARKADLTSAVSTVKASDVLKNRSIGSFEVGMQGLASGVHVIQNSGEPGGGVTVRVRGMSSISAGNDPLYVIDGVPFFNNPKQLNLQGWQQTGWLSTETNPPNTSMAAINPNDIESIEILKDASATAIYGNRGANGVILITTKKGKAGQNKINFDMSFGWQNLARKVDLLESKDYVTYNHEMLDYLASLGQTSLFQRFPDNASDVNTDWQKELTTRNAPITDYNLSFSGGNQGITYFISGNLRKENGIIPLTGFERQSIRANLETRISDKFNAGIDMTISYARQENGFFNEGNLGFTLNGGDQRFINQPVVRAYNSDGSLNTVNPYPDLGAVTDRFISPIRSKANPMLDELNTTTYRSLGNIFIKYQIFKDLSFRSSMGIDFINVQREQWRPKNVYYPQDNYNIGFAFLSNVRFPSYIWENQINWIKTINDHSLNVTAVYAMEWHNRFSLRASTQNFLDNNLKYNDMTAGSQVNPTQSNQTSWQSVSYAGRINYSFKSRYLVSASLRADGSSKFANNPFGFFPAVSAAWRLSEESFLKDLAFFDNLKLRAGWGANGNDDIDPYQTLLTYGVVQYPFGGALAVGVKPNLLPYPDLTWEKTNMTSGGVDMTVFRGRIDLTAEYYYKRTNDLLLVVNIPAASGFATMLQNVGSIENKGVDISLTTQNLTGKFSWSTKFNFSLNRNKVLKLSGARDAKGNRQNYIYLSPETGTYGTRIEEGHPLGEYYGHQFAIFHNQEELLAIKNRGIVGLGAQAAGIDVTGPNGVKDSLITDLDRVWLGNPAPKYTFGLENTLAYKGFNLRFFFNVSQGNMLWVQNYQPITKGPLIKKYFDDRWSPTNTDTDIPRATDVFGSGNGIWDASFIRLQYATLSYDLPANVTGKLKIGGLRLFVTGQNLFVITEYPGYDPEVSAAGNNAILQGIERAGYPKSKTWMVGINLQL